MNVRSLFVVITSLFFHVLAQQPELPPTCNGVVACTPATMNKQCVRLSEGGDKLFCNPTKDEVIVIKSDGTPINSLYPGLSDEEDGLCLYDCGNAGHRTNECCTMKQLSFHAYQIDATIYPNQNDLAPSPITNDGKGVIAMQAVSLLRNWDRHSTDREPANFGLSSHAKFGVHGIRALPRSFLEEQVVLKDKPSDVSQEEFYDKLFLPDFNREFIYKKAYEKSRIQLADLERNNLKKYYATINELYPQTAVPGVFLNKKDDGDECESAGCDEVGPQVVTFDDANPWGIARWSSFQPSAKNTYIKHGAEENIVFMALDGDTKAKWDDLMLFFQVPVSLLASGKSILYRQTNTEDGIDYIIILKYIKRP